jgi:hypothetical protein
MKFARISIFVVAAVSGVVWGIERNTTTRLRLTLDGVHEHDRTYAQLHSDHDDLIQFAPNADELASLRPKVLSRGSVASVASGSPARKKAEDRALRPGFWAPAAAWKNRGRASPEEAVETMLWAASGGDLDALKETLSINDETRAKAENMLTTLPGAARSQYATPEDLLAVVIAGNVPLDSAQVVARQQNDADHVTEYLRLKNADGITRQVYLSLYQSPDGWRLVVPSSVVEQLGRGPADGTSP